MLKVCGINDSSELGEESNNKTVKRFSAIIPPIQSHLDAQTILSLSIGQEKSVVVTQDGVIQGVGNNCDGQISRSLPQYIIDEYKQFEIKDGDDNLYIPISVVCGDYHTLYLVSNPDNIRNYLALCHSERKESFPLFLDTKNLNPVALFGGCKNAAAIDSDGSIIIVLCQLIKTQPDSMVHITTLPDNEKAVSVACGDQFFLALSSSGRVFESPVSDQPKFTEISELQGKEITNISGVYDHYFAVTKDGRVFGRGKNNSGQLGLSRSTKEFEKFTEISSLSNHKIKAAYAGAITSLFQTYKGRILACGDNDCGQLFLDKASTGGVDSPVETLITSGCLFCIAGTSSAAFINCSPVNGPNRKIGEDDDLNDDDDDERHEEIQGPKKDESDSKGKENDTPKEHSKPVPEEGNSKCCLLI